MPPKKASASGVAALQPLDPNQETLSLREARSQKRTATSPTLQEEELDQEIRNMEIIHQQVQRKKEKTARLADLQRQIDEATEEVRHLVQDEQDWRLQHRELYQEGLYNNDRWYDDFNHDTFTFDDASPLAAELQDIPWPPSYKPPQLPMYDGHSDPKQFLMSYEATISSYGGNAAVMAKSFVMAVRNVAQTWYSSLWPGTITSWQKLKDMLVTSFQGFQTKPVIAQALFQCTQDHEEYLQAYVRRFLHLRAQAPTVPNEIVGKPWLRGFVQDQLLSILLESPHRLWRSCFRRWMNTSGLIMTSAKEGRKHTGSLKWPGASKEESIRGTSGQFTTQPRVMPKEVNNRDRSILRKLRGSNKALSGRQLQEVEAPGASEEDMGTSPGISTAYFVVKTRATIQGRVKSPSKSKKKLHKPKPRKISRSRSCTLLRVIHLTY
jgi:hypothetical protein